ncbi:hypothetical protein AB4505_08565 [Vibrio splendidus]
MSTIKFGKVTNSASIPSNLSFHQVIRSIIGAFDVVVYFTCSLFKTRGAQRRWYDVGASKREFYTDIRVQ